MTEFLFASSDSVCTEYILSLCAFNDDEIYVPSGTATMIGPNIAMTAKHVITDFFKVYDNREFKGNEGVSKKRGTFQLFAIHPGSGSQWKVNLNYFLADKSDIAFLWLIPDNENAKTRETIFAKLNLIVPDVNETIFTYGYIATGGQDPVQTVDFGNGEKRTLAFSKGKIVEIYEYQRDASRLNFPCFQTNTRFDGGMSGGPIFNLSKEVIGVVCSSLPATAPGEEHASFTSLLWPSMLFALSVPFPSLDLPERYPMLFLAEAGVINAKGWRKLELLKPTSEGLFLEIRIHK